MNTLLKWQKYSHDASLQKVRHPAQQSLGILYHWPLIYEVNSMSMTGKFISFANPIVVCDLGKLPLYACLKFKGPAQDDNYNFGS